MTTEENAAPVVVFKKLSDCEAGACLEIAQTADLVHLRSSRFPARVLTLDADEWEAAVAAIRAQQTGEEKNA